MELKSKWETENLAIEVYRNEADKKYTEINELNKILHSQLEALHIKLAEKEKGIASGGSSKNLADDDGLQNVMNYLRRSKEIAETEISLLKQEKHRLQSQLESALKSAESAQTLLHSERGKLRNSLFTEDEFKSLQLQVRELTLLRESNVQLREENKNNFEECQKLREAFQNAKIETENLEKLLRDRERVLEAYRKDAELLKAEKVHLEKRIDELVQKCKDIDANVNDYNQLKESLKQMQINLGEKDAQLEELKKLLSEKQDTVSILERDLARSKSELSERENRLNEILQAEASLKSDVEKLKRMNILSRRKSDALVKEKEEMSKEVQALSKQLEEAKQGFSKQLEEAKLVKRTTVDTGGELNVKDARIQSLEKAVEKHRDEIKKEKEDHLKDKQKFHKMRKTIVDSHANVSQEKKNLSDELQKHKLALKALQDEVEKLKYPGSSQSESTAFSSNILDDFASAYFQAVDNFEQLVQPLSTDPDPTMTDAPTPFDNASSVAAPTGQAVPSSPSRGPPAASVPSTRADVKEKRPVLTKASLKMGRKLVRPNITKPRDPQADVEMAEGDDSSTGLPSQSTENQGTVSAPTTVSVRKRLQEEMLTSEETSSDVPAPITKKAKALDSVQVGADEPAPAPAKLPEVVTTEEFTNELGNLQPSKEEIVEKDELEEGEQTEEPSVEEQIQVELSDTVDAADERSEKLNEAILSDDQLRDQTEQDIQRIVAAESGGEREEGELVTDFADNDGDSNETGGPGNEEFQGEQSADPEKSPSTEPLGLESGEIDPTQTLEEEKLSDVTENVFDNSDKLNDGADSTAETEKTSNLPTEETSTSISTISTAVDAGSSDQGGSKPVSPLNSGSTTINLQERARQRAHLRQAGMGVNPSPSIGRGRTIRGGRGVRGGRAGRGQSPG